MAERAPCLKCGSRSLTHDGKPWCETYGCHPVAILDNAAELRAWADNDTEDERATMMRLVAAEIVRLRDQYRRSQRYWIEAADIAIQRGDFRPLQLRIDASKFGPINITETV